MKLILFEFVDEAEDFLKNHGRSILAEPSSLAVALNPKVRSFLIAQDISAVGTLDYFDNDGHKNIVTVVAEIIERLRGQIQLKDSLGVSEAYNHFWIYHLKFYLNYALSAVELLNNICVKHDIQEIYVYGNQFLNPSSALLDDQERPLGEIVSDFAFVRKISCHILKAPFEGREDRGNWNDKPALGVRLYFQFYNYLRKLSLKKSKESFVVPTWGYKFDDLVREFKKRFPQSRSVLIMDKSGKLKRQIRLILMTLANIFSYPKNLSLFDYIVPLDLLLKENPQTKTIFDHEINQLNQLLKNGYRDLGIFHGVNVGAIVLSKVNTGLKFELKEIAGKVRLLKSVLEELSPKVVISGFSMGLYYALGEVCRILKIPSCIISHGTHVPPNNRYEDIENYWLGRGVILNEYETVAVQTPWTQKFLEYYKDERRKIVAGPLILARKDSQPKSTALVATHPLASVPVNAKIILYAATQRDRYGQRFYITETTDEFVQSLCDIVNAINKIPNLFLVIRPHPSCDLTQTDFQRLLPKSQQFATVNQGRFQELLSHSDLVISYASTCIEEALNNNIPVILYDRWQRYNHFNLPALNGKMNSADNAAVYINKVEVLYNYLSSFSKLGNVQEKAFDSYKYGWESNANFFQYIQNCLSPSVDSKDLKVDTMRPGKR